MKSTFRTTLAICAITLLTSTTAQADWTIKGGSQGLGEEVPSEARGIVVTGDQGLGQKLLWVGPTYWFGWPHYVWFDHTDGMIELMEKEVAFLSKYGDVEAVELAATIAERLEDGPKADYELHCELVWQEKAYLVTATNHLTGAQDTAWVDAGLLLINPLKATHPVLQALVNVMSLSK